MPTLNLTGRQPEWISSQAYRAIQDTFKRALGDSGLATVEATIRPST